ncbi:MAG TPA: glycoside hydrolase family 31 protein [Armatimonadota bacterium]|nr:glycoside hydrolase family 31 protein [Armatimonadota bacterium]HOS43025.1 glycoside hydrolase family 31 protein [Armatimonadota bacterium]
MAQIRTDGHRISWRRGQEIVWIEPWGADSARVRAAPAPGVRELPGALLPPEQAGKAEIAVGNHGAELRNGKLVVTISDTGWIRFLRADGAVLLEELPHLLVRDFKSLDGGAYRIQQRFRAYPGERLYGMGQHQHGLLDQKGAVLELRQQNTEVNIPFVVSNRRYGFLWNNPAVGVAEFATNFTRWTCDAAQQIDYWLTAGDDYAELLRHYADATGHAPMMPEWASGFWQCKLRYRTQEELLSVAREYTRRGLPISVIVVDYFHWTMMGEWRFDPACWPDPAGMVRELKAMGIELMVSIWPTVNPNSDNYGRMQDAGLLALTERGLPAVMSFEDTRPAGRMLLSYYDPTNPEAREFLWQQVKEHYYDLGIHIFWLDACEPEIMPMDHDHMRYHLGNGAAVGNLYPMLHERAFYDGMTAAGEQRVLNLCRSAWAGSQRYGAAVWSGDIPSTFEALRAQVRAGLNIAMSGIPWWTTDIGGFHGGDVASADFRELIVRWFQYGVFCPLFRLHGVRQPGTAKSGGPNEVWSFGEDAYAIITGLMRLRERLRPYIMAQMQLAHTHGTPPMRPLFFDFPDDEAAYAADDQFLFGPDLLIAPVLEQGATRREVYLPDGDRWRDAWTDAIHVGGQWLTVEAPLHCIPVFVRGDAELPLREEM